MSLQNRAEVAKKDVLEKTRNLNGNFVQLNSEAILTKQTNSFLAKRLVVMEPYFLGNHQYSRGECLKLPGILGSI